MISFNGAGYAPNSSGNTGQNSKSHGDGAARHTNQVNIQTATEQDLSSAVSPVIKSEALRNHHEEQPEELNNDKTGDGEKLTEEEQKQVDDLKKRDAEVRAHEQSHAAVGGSYASSPSYEFETGPDNKQYAVGGEVQIDSAPIPNNPKATIEKMDIVIRAALAPADPSSQDKKVASQAQKNRSEAQAALAKQNEQQLQSRNDKTDEPNQSSPDTKSVQLRTEAEEKSSTSNELIFTAILAYNTAANLG